MSPLDLATAVQPLLGTLRDLCDAYVGAQSTARAVIVAMSSGNPAAVAVTVAVQVDEVEAIGTLNNRRQDIERRLAVALSISPDVAEGDAAALTCSQMVSLLPADAAATLLQLRHELLTAMVELQRLNNQAAGLARTAQVVISRSLRASLPQTIGYGPHGELALAPGLHSRARSA